MGSNAMHLCTTCGLFDWSDWLGPSARPGVRRRLQDLLDIALSSNTEKKRAAARANSEVFPRESARLHLELGLHLPSLGLRHIHQ